MGYVMKKKPARKENYGGTRSIAAIKYIVIHFTGNDGDSDEANAKYFHDRIVKASAHYFVDGNSVTQSVSDNCIAYSVGGKKWSDCSKTGGGKLYGIAKNANTLNIELCDSKKDGKIMATEATLANAAELCKKLMKKYGIDVNHVIRHFDVNGKHCPAYFMNETEWTKFKKRLTATESKPTNNKPAQSATSYMIKVSRKDLYIRKGPGTDYGKNGFIDPGSYTIIAESTGKGSTKGWGKLKSGAGWISLDFVTRL